MNVEQKVEAAFNDPSAESYTDDYLAELRTNWRDTEKELRRSIFLILVLGFVFELVNRGGITELSIGLAKVTNSNVIRAIIPVVVAYLLNTILAMMADIAFFIDLQERILKVKHKAIAENDLESCLTPANSLIFYQQRIAQLVYGDEIRLYWIIAYIVSFFLRVVLLIVLPICLLIYAYGQLFNLYGWVDWPTIVSCIIATLLTINGFVVLPAIRDYLVGEVRTKKSKRLPSARKVR
jgi:hypothetical protein